MSRFALYLPRLSALAAATAGLLLTGPAAHAWQGADDCANAQPISGVGPHAFDNTSATPTPNLADCNGVAVRKDVWFLWNASVDARVTIEVCGQTSLDMRMAVYQGGTCASPQLIVCGTDNCPAGSLVTFNADAGQDYLFRMGSRFVGQSGTGTFTLRQSIPIFNATNGSYYEVVNETLSWTQARGRAETMEWKGRMGHLAVYNDLQERDYIIQNANVNRAWMGLFQDLSNPNYSEPLGGWVWIDGSTAVMPEWATGEPNNAGVAGEDFAETFGGSVFNDVVDGHSPTTQFVIEWDAPFGMNYCMANTNSTGQVASMAASGSDVVTDNDLTLSSTQLPANAFSFYITSQAQGFVANPAGSAGNLCLSGGIGRYVGPGQIQQANTSGTIGLAIDLTGIPTPGGLVSGTAGETWNFQAWYRDAVSGTPTSNFTDGISILLR
jgi:hypothetical protein